MPLFNDLAPAVSSSVAQLDSGNLSYQYEVSNGQDAKDAIGAFTLVVPPQDPGLRVFPRPGDPDLPWPGVAAFVAVAKQPLYPASAPGRYLLWFHQGDSLIRPGQTLRGFGLESSYRPGLTTAWFSSGKLVEFDQEWPREIFQQLDLLEDMQWREKDVVTVGPMFPPDTPRKMIIQTIRTAMHQMMRAGRLSASSPFLAEVLGMLQDRELADPGAKRPVLTTRPGSDTERAVAAALQFSLGISVRSASSAPLR